MPYNPKIYFTLFLFFFSLLSFGREPKAFPSKTFTASNIFNSDAFLKNKDFINDCHGTVIEYFIDHQGLTAFFTEKGVIYKLSKIEEDKKEEHKAKEKEGEEHEGKGIPIATSYVWATWLGANLHPVITAEQKKDGYYTAIKPIANGYKPLKTEGYKTITYHDLYPGIDAVYTIPEKGGIEYSLIVHAGADASTVQVQYSGAIKSLKLNQAGNLCIHTLSGDLIEHAPNSYLEDKTPIASTYQLKGNKLHFHSPQNYDHSQTLTIDPWITTLTTLPPLNLGVDVDYDLNGNLFVYGPGCAFYDSTSNFLKLAKCDVNGTALWTFIGSVSSINWSTDYLSGAINAYLSNIKVDKSTGKTYMGKGYDRLGTSLIRIDTNGVYDNFVSAVNGNFQEIWDFAYNCSTGEILALGGGTTSSLTMGVVNTTSGAVATSNVTGYTGSSQDIVNGTYDPFGNLYVVMASGLDTAVNNYLFKVNNAYNGKIWTAPTTFHSLYESYNATYYFPGASNSYNALAANSNYLFYYDGYNVSAYSLTTGARVIGIPTTISGNTVMNEGGIAVDACNNVYIGGIGAIKTFTFNGTVFIPGADISLGAGHLNDHLHDVKYNTTNNLLYVAGSNIVGTFNPTLSINCGTTGTYTVRVDSTCSSAVVHVSAAAGFTNPVFTYVWLDSTNHIVRQKTATIDSLDSLSNVSPGRYTVEVQLSLNCGGTSVTKSVHIQNQVSLSVPDTTICSGQSLIINTTASPSGGTFLWSPNSSTNSSDTVSPTITTIYKVSYTLGTCTANDSVLVGVITVGNSTQDTAVCAGQPITLTSVPNSGGITYLWSPGGQTTPSITVSPSTTSVYTVTYTKGACSGTLIDTVKAIPVPMLTQQSLTTCPSTNVQLSTTPSIAGGTYLWSPGGQTTPSINVSASSTSVFTVTYTVNTCSTSAFDTVTIIPLTLSLDNDSLCAGQTTTIKAIANNAGGVYSWSPVASSTDSITVSPLTTSYYTVTYSLNSCTVTQTDTVTVFPSPTLTTANDTICPKTTATITVTPSIVGGTYSWNPTGATTQSITVSPNTTAYYSVTYSFGGCSVTGADTVLVRTPLNLTDSIIQPLCFGDNNGSILLTISGGQSPYSFLWNNNDVTQNLVNIPANTYSVIVTDSTLCKDTLPNIVVTQPIQLTVQLNATPISCANHPDGTVTAVVNGGTPIFTYQWSIAGTLDSIVNLNPGQYQCTVTDSHFCTAANSVTLSSVSPLTLINSTLANPLCPPASNGFIFITVSGGTPQYAYNWSNGNRIDSGIVNLSPGTYQLTITDSKECVLQDSFTLHYLDTLRTAAGNPASLTLGQQATIHAISNLTNGIHYKWTPAFSLSCDTCASTAATPIHTTLYQVIAYDTNGCQASDTVTLTVISNYDLYFPNAFSPNGDGNNDAFQIFGRLEAIKQFQISIYNRIGEKVFESTDAHFAWDGKCKGTLQTPGVFVYTANIVFIDDHTESNFKGSISLVR